MSIKDRILFVFSQYDVKNASDVSDYGTEIHQKLYKQLFSNYSKGISTDVITYILEKYPEVSADYLLRGEGTWKRNNAPVVIHRQDIHSDGAPVAVSQHGTANVNDTKKEQQPEATAPVNVAEMFRNQDWSMVVSLLQQHDRELLALKDQRIADLEKELELLRLLFKSITNK